MRYLLMALVLLCGCEIQKVPPKVILLAFQASWCGPCHQMEPVLRSLESEGFKVKRIDVDENPKLAAKYGVQALPTFVVIKDGHETWREVGVVSKEKLKDALTKQPKKFLRL